MVRRNFVALVVVALMVSFCGTPPEAGDLRTTTSEQQEVETKSNKVVITAVAVGAGVIVCYLAPGLKTKCPSWVKSSWASSKKGVTWVTKRVSDGSKKVWEGVKKPFRKKSGETSLVTKDSVDDASEAATKGKKIAEDSADK